MKLLAHGAALAALAVPCLAGSDVPYAPWTNSLGQVLVPLPGTNALVATWETRVKDFEGFATETRLETTGNTWSLYKERWRQGPFSWKSPGFAQTGEHPVCGVSWLDARAFCEWLTQKERAAGRLGSNQAYRLPYDAEWSRLAGTNRYPSGDAWSPTAAATGNYAGQEARDEHWYSEYPVVTNHTDPFPRTAPVASFAPTAAGLHDLGGNVWEWCEDAFRESIVPSDILAADPALGNRGRYRVLRGGSWREGGPLETRLDYRRPLGADHRYSDIGFRCVLQLQGGPAPLSPAAPAK
jgi:formylglycine-generating enzyme required for sulfatase activity